MVLEKDILQRINKKLGHFMLLANIGMDQKKKARTLTKREEKAVLADIEELTFLINKVNEELK